MFDYQIQLIGLVESINENGFPDVVEEPKDPILANEISVRSNDFWLAKQSSVEIVHAFEVHYFEYNGEEKALYGGKEYRIERTFKKGDLTELYLSRKSDDHET